MKKTFFLLVAAAIAVTACNKTVTVEQNPGDEINFRPLMTNQTKAAAVSNITTANLSSFIVNAKIATTETSYFDNATYSNDGGTYKCAAKYYWPATESLDFYAYAPTSNAQVAVTNYKTFTVTPASGANPTQVDLVYAATKGKNKAADNAGVVLNFRHTGAKIVCQVKNTSTALKFGVEGWKVGYLSPSGTFTFADANTDGNNSTTLAAGQWGSLAAASVATEYASTFDKVDIAASASETVLAGEFVLVPQTLTAAGAYASTAVDAKLNGAFIAVKLYILNNTNSALVAGGGTTAAPTTIWAIWPINTTWLPGKEYTYTIDLAGGGYYEVNQTEAPAAETTDLDPLLENAEIKFVTVTVDNWSAASGIDVSGPTL